MKLDEAQRILGCYIGGNPPATIEDVMRSFHARVMETHPDTGKPDPSMSVTALITARNLLRQAVAQRVETQNNACGTCKGSGSIRGRFGSTPCASCKGSGSV